MKFKLLIIALLMGHLTSAQVKVQLDNQITLTLPNGANVVTDYAKLGSTNEMTELVLKSINKHVYKIEDIIIRFFPAKYQGDEAQLIKIQTIYRKWYGSKKNGASTNYYSEIITLNENKVLETSYIADNKLNYIFLYINPVKKVSFRLEMISGLEDREKSTNIINNILKSIIIN